MGSNGTECPNLLCYPIFSRSKLQDINFRRSSERKRKKYSPNKKKKLLECYKSNKENAGINNSQEKNGAKLSQQMYLDVGQKRFGHATCSTCGMIYNQSQIDDEHTHMIFHEKFIGAIRFVGWKNERIVAHYSDGRVIVVLPEDHWSHVKKIEEIKLLIDDQLGIPREKISLQQKPYKVFLFISNNKTVMGCLIAVDIDSASRLLEPAANCCSDERVPATCGVSRIWVDRRCRRRKIATRMMECLTLQYAYGRVLNSSEIAFSHPTAAGRAFAIDYFKSSAFLVYP